MSTMKRPSIVVLGGGTGQPALLRGLRRHDVNIVSVVTMMDNGGSSGVLRRDHDFLPPGDVRRCLIALSADPDGWGLEWNTRDENGHAIGNLALFERTQELDGDLQAAIDSFAEEFGLQDGDAHYEVLGVTMESVQLHARLEDGTELAGEEAIDISEDGDRAAIQDLFLEPAAAAQQRVLDAIAGADVVVISMGDLFTSAIPNLLVEGVTQAIADSGAQVVYVCNRTNKQGETHGYTIADYATQIQRYVAPAQLHVLIADDQSVSAEAEKEMPALVEVPAVQVVQTDLSDPQSANTVSGEKAANAIVSVCISS